MRNIAIAACLLLSPTAFAASPTCDAFNKAIEASLKDAAQSWAESIGDNSAPRAQLAQAKVANEYTEVQINLKLLIENKCPVPTKPLRWATYAVEALQCSNDRLSARLKGATDDPPSCKIENWKGQSDQEAKAP